MKKIVLYLLLVATSMFIACDDTIKDEEVPKIDITSDDAFPQNCATVYRGESFVYKIRITDNVQLGSYSSEMHNNFDHHTHSTSVTECEPEPIKTAINPLYFMDEFSIPENQTEYIATGEIDIPNDVDLGDYHFVFRVTDKSGWQNYEGISMKVADR